MSGALKRDEWKTVRLGDVCDVNMGQSPDSKTYNSSGVGLPFYQGNADFGLISPSATSWCSEPKKTAHKDDILISVRAPIGALNIADETCCIGRGLAALTVNPELCFQKYIWHCLISKVPEFNRKGTGSTFKAINKTGLTDTKIPLPPLDVQRRIAETLDKVTELITLRKTQLKKLDELVKARFVEMFGDPLNDTAKYPLHQVGEVAEAIDPQPSHRTPPIEEGGIPYVSIKDCDYKTGIIDFDGARKVSRTVLEEHLNRYILQDGDFIIGKIGTIGKPVFVPARNDYTLSANIVLVQPNSKLVSPCFLKYSFESDFVERQFTEAKNSTSQAAFGIQKVRAVEVMNPELDVQRDFERFVEQTDKSKVIIQQSLDTLETLKKSLMQEYFG